jgi:F420-dependent oxidoreductase-like protein
MRVGLQVSNFTWPGGPAEIGATFGRIAEEAEGAGLASLWVMDHFFQISMIGPAELEMLEGYSTLAFAAGRTKQIKLGTLVTGVTYRHPGLLIKTVTTLDVLSGGRAYLGIGAAWNEEEHRGLGVPYPATAERFERLEETLRLAHQMWAGDERPFNGAHYQLARPLNSPQTLQRPHPPIMIGGGGEKKTLRLVAQYADACNLFGNMPTAELRRKLDILREHCAAVGRPYQEIEKTALIALKVTRDGADGTTTPSAAIEQLGALAELGFDHAILSLQGQVTDPQIFDLLATDVIPQATALSVAGR